MRTSADIKENGAVRFGFDYTLQVWVKDFIIQDCGHKPDTCRCNARRLKGRDVRGWFGTDEINGR